MDNLNDNLNEDFNGDLAENLNETRKQASGCLRRFSKSIKAVVIAFLILLLLIPMFMIEDMISELRANTDGCYCRSRSEVESGADNYRTLHQSEVSYHTGR